MRRTLPAFALLAALAGCAQPAAPLPLPEGPAASAPASVPAAAAPTASPAAAPARGSDPIPEGKFVFYEDFEHGYDKWDMPAPKDGLGLQQLNAFSCGGLWSVHLGKPEQAGFTPVEAEYVLALKQPMDFSKAVKPFLKYDVKGAIRPMDALDATAEVRGADGKWTPVGRRIDGGYSLMASIGADLSAYAGQPKVDLRFRMVTHAATEPTQGFYLDDIQVLEPNQ